MFSTTGLPLSKREEPPRVLMSDAGGSRTNAYNLSACLWRFVVGGSACCQPRQEALVRIELVVAGRRLTSSRPPFADAFVVVTLAATPVRMSMHAGTPRQSLVAS
jgi:hypothetical protein